MILRYDINKDFDTFIKTFNNYNNIYFLKFKQFINNENINKFSEVLKNNKSLIKLSLTNKQRRTFYYNNVINYVDHFDDYTNIINSLSINTNLTSLDLTNINFKDKENGLTNSLIKSNSIIKLNISDTHLSAENVSKLLSNCTNLTNLSINDKYNNTIINDEFIKIISEPLKNNDTLQFLFLNCQKVKNISPLTDALINNNSLHTLLLRHIVLVEQNDNVKEFIVSINLESIIKLIVNNKSINTLSIYNYLDNYLYGFSSCHTIKVSMYVDLIRQALEYNISLTKLC